MDHHEACVFADAAAAACCCRGAGSGQLRRRPGRIGQPRRGEAERLQYAVTQVETLQSSGKRVWCVPFARNASGIEIYGNAKTWWGQAKGQFDARP